MLWNWLLLLYYFPYKQIGKLIFIYDKAHPKTRNSNRYKRNSNWWRYCRIDFSYQAYSCKSQRYRVSISPSPFFLYGRMFKFLFFGYSPQNYRFMNRNSVRKDRRWVYHSTMDAKRSISFSSLTGDDQKSSVCVTGSCMSFIPWNP